MNSKITYPLLFILLSSTFLTAQEDIFSKKYIQNAMKAAFEWQQEHPKHAPNDWTNGAYYTGVTEAWKTTGDKDYRQAILYADAHKWNRPEVENMIWWWCDALFMGPP